MALITGPTIAAGQSLSDAIDFGQTKPFLIISPPDWTPANLTFQVSIDGTAFFGLHMFASAMRIVGCVPNTAYVLDQELWPKNVWMKFRSGTPESPVIQTAARVFKVLTV